jgi:alkanesulfonate monooxygenase SsuD/methylene tetrahydromethanopterin reductase-like flavin-dependent oxidoreductase (luciferase family)
MESLQFGVFLPPRSADIGRLREHVQVAETAGFDYVSFQDHPYVPDFLDTFALIGTLIGQTSRLRFMTNVANLPLRPGQMLAKTSASLDLLSGGRFELGLGAGRAWDQIAGLGGPRRSPREALAAVSEAIDVLHALWLPDRRASLPGPYYPVTLSGHRRHRARPRTPHPPVARRRGPPDARPDRPQGRRLDRAARHWL